MIEILESKMKKSSYMKNSIQKIFLIVLGFIVGIICKLLWHKNWVDSFIKWASLQDLGSIAEWAGAIVLVIAISAGFCQIKKQNSFNRALKVEGLRPKFTCHFLTKTSGKDSIILTNDTNIIESDLDIMLIRQAEKHCLIEVQNISKNSVYKVDIKLVYDDGTDEIFNFSGFQSPQKIILIPGKAMQGKKEKIKKVIIRFVTPGNEMGYCLYDGTYRYQDGSLKFVHPIYKYKKTSNHEIMVNSDMNESFLTSKDLKNVDYKFDEDKMYKNGIIYHNYSAYEKKDKSTRNNR